MAITQDLFSTFWARASKGRTRARRTVAQFSLTRIASAAFIRRPFGLFACWQDAPPRPRHSSDHPIAYSFPNSGSACSVNNGVGVPASGFHRRQYDLQPEVEGSTSATEIVASAVTTTPLFSTRSRISHKEICCVSSSTGRETMTRHPLVPLRARLRLLAIVLNGHRPLLPRARVGKAIPPTPAAGEHPEHSQSGTPRQRPWAPTPAGMSRSGIEVSRKIQ
jgi:hypothetical protein